MNFNTVQEIISHKDTPKQVAGPMVRPDQWVGMINNQYANLPTGDGVLKVLIYERVPEGLELAGILRVQDLDVTGSATSLHLASGGSLSLTATLPEGSMLVLIHTRGKITPSTHLVTIDDDNGSLRLQEMI